MSFKKKSFDLTGKVAIVLGGTRGIGRGIAVTLADHGADVIPASRNIENAKSVVAEIEAIGRKSMVVSIDSSKMEDLEKLRDDVLAKFGRIDILVNSQGVERRGYIKDYSLEDWRAVMAVNLDSVFMATKVFGNVMINQKAGKIINIASMSSYLGLVEAPAYTASKGAVLQFTKASALEFAPYNVQVNGIAPGWFKTELTSPIHEHNKPLYEMIKGKIPAGEWGDVEDLGACAVFLASDASSYVTGDTIAVDGGFLYNGA